MVTDAWSNWVARKPSRGRLRSGAHPVGPAWQAHNEPPAAQRLSRGRAVGPGGRPVGENQPQALLGAHLGEQLGQPSDRYQSPGVGDVVGHLIAAQQRVEQPGDRVRDVGVRAHRRAVAGEYDVLAGDDVRGEVGLYPAVVEGHPRPVDVPEAGDPAFDAKLRLVRGADRLRRALALGVTGAGGEDVEAAVALLLK